MKYIFTVCHILFRKGAWDIPENAAFISLKPPTFPMITMK
jgi:hypothetical protein